MATGFNYAQSANLAHSLLSYFGAAAIVTRRIEGAYSTETGSAAISNRSFSATACVMSLRDKRDTDAVQRAERRVLISPLSAYEPMVGDLIKVGSLQFQITDVDKVAPAGKTVLYDCEVRA